MPAIHFMEFREPNKPGLCSIGLTTKVKFLFTREQTEVTCRSCIHKLMKFTGNTKLYKQGYPDPPIGLRIS